MTFMEAVLEAKRGKKIAYPGCDGDYADWSSGLFWRTREGRNLAVVVDDDALRSEWEVVKNPPPKLYAFAEAYAMMKAGKWMRPLGWKSSYVKMQSVEWIHRDEFGVCYHSSRMDFSDEMVDSKWIEVTP